MAAGGWWWWQMWRQGSPGSTGVWTLSVSCCLCISADMTITKWTAAKSIGISRRSSSARQVLCWVPLLFVFARFDSLFNCLQTASLEEREEKHRESSRGNSRCGSHWSSLIRNTDLTENWSIRSIDFALLQAAEGTAAVELTFTSQINLSNEKKRKILFQTETTKAEYNWLLFNILTVFMTRLVSFIYSGCQFFLLQLRLPPTGSSLNI